VPEYPKRRQVGEHPYGDPALATYEQLRMLVLCRNNGDLLWRNGHPMLVLRPGRCERCAAWYATEAHHRWMRSQGGPDIASNLGALCRVCHNWCHANPEAAHAEGWMLIRGDKPAATPVLLAGGLRALLTDGGLVEYMPSESRSFSDDLRTTVEKIREARA
jgi:hypothetical protein